MQPSNAREPVLALLTPERWAKRIGDFDRLYPFGVLVAKLDRGAQPQRITERIGEKRAGILARQNCLWMQGRRHVDAFREIIIANEIDIFCRQVGTDAGEKGAQVWAGPLPDVIPAFHADVADYQFLLRQSPGFLAGDGETCHLMANSGHAPQFEEYFKQHPIAISRGSLTGRTVLECKVVHIPDAQTDPEYTMTELISLDPFRTMLGVPLLREGKPIGVITLTRATVRPFTNQQIQLVRTFADQAVIAIENARLFEEIQDIRVIFVDEPDDSSPFGIKGLGEIGIVGVAAAIANAVYHATGKRVRDLPITLDKLRP